MIAAAKAGDWSADGEVVAGGVALQEGEYELVLEAASADAAIQFLPGGGFVVLDTATTPELEAEGLARDLVRAIQDARKAAGLDVSDRIRLDLECADPADAEDLRANQAMIAGETLALACTIGSGADAADPAATGGHRTVLEGGRYANRGSIVVDLWRANGTGAADV